MPLIQRPNAVGIFLCRLIVVEEKTRNLTLANSMQNMEFDRFPTPPTPMEVYTLLTDGLGDVALDLVVSRCATLEPIYVRSAQVTFQTPLRKVGMRWHVHSCSFPFPGNYEFALQANGETITQQIIQVASKGTKHG
jgi:hypothetical protein